MSRQKLQLSHHLNHHSYPWFLQKWPGLIHAVYLWNHLLLQRNQTAKKNLLRELRQCNKGNVLDAGCGEGLFIFPYCKRFPAVQFFGVDKNEHHLHFCRNYILQSGCKNVRFYQKELTADLPGELADLILCIGTLQYIGDDEKALLNLHHSLKEKGKIIIYVPINGRVILPIYRRFFLQKKHYEKSQNRARVYTEEEIIFKLKLAGFQVLKKEYTYGLMGILGHELYSILLMGIGSEKWYSFLYILLLFIGLPLILLLVWGDYFLKKQHGNGLLIVAKK